MGEDNLVWEARLGKLIGRRPSKREQELKNLLDLTRTGTKAARIDEIKEMGKSGTDFMGSGWYLFRLNLMDSDAEIRAAAFQAARGTVAVGVDDVKGVPPKQ